MCLLIRFGATPVVVFYDSFVENFIGFQCLEISIDKFKINTAISAMLIIFFIIFSEKMQINQPAAQLSKALLLNLNI